MTASTPESREALLRELVAIPSTTCSAGEDAVVRFFVDRLSRLDYYKERPSHLETIEISDAGGRTSHAAAALMRARDETASTIVLIAHVDTVSAACYGSLEPWACDPDGLASRLGAEAIPDEAARDLASGSFIFGRGVMDMKCGLALEMELLRDFDADRDLLDVNLLVLALPDEENMSAGARACAAHLARMKREIGLDYLACIDTEPTDAGIPDTGRDLIFLGTLGKLMPTFYCRGVESHVGCYYHGVSAALMSSLILAEAEASPRLADPEGGVCFPSWICLRHETLHDGYSVTVPNRSLIFFNCLITKKTPAQVMQEMHEVARRAAEETISRLRASHSALRGMGYEPGCDGLVEIRAMPFEDVIREADRVLGGEGTASELMRRRIVERALPDARDAGIDAFEELLRATGLERALAPFIAYGFLPPFNPPATSLDGSARGSAAVRAARETAERAREAYGVDLGITEWYTGICDLSFAGISSDISEVAPYERSCLGWGTTFSVPFADMREIDMPILNIGPRGRDPHRTTERLDRRYSLDVLPELLLYLLKKISRLCAEM